MTTWVLSKTRQDSAFHSDLRVDNFPGKILLTCILKCRCPSCIPPEVSPAIPIQNQGCDIIPGQYIWARVVKTLHSAISAVCLDIALACSNLHWFFFQELACQMSPDPFLSKVTTGISYTHNMQSFQTAFSLKQAKGFMYYYPWQTCSMILSITCSTPGAACTYIHASKSPR